MRRLLLIAALTLACAAGCTDAERQAFENKCDAPLRTRVETMLQGGSSERIEVLGKLTGALDADKRHRLEAAGAEIGTITEPLFTARMRAADVAHVAALDFVASLQLAQVRDPQ